MDTYEPTRGPEMQISDERLAELVASYRLHNTMARLGKHTRHSPEDDAVTAEIEEVMAEYKSARDACAAADKKRCEDEDERLRKLGIIK